MKNEKMWLEALDDRTMAATIATKAVYGQFRPLIRNQRSLETQIDPSMSQNNIAKAVLFVALRYRARAMLLNGSSLQSRMLNCPPGGGKYSWPSWRCCGLLRLCPHCCYRRLVDELENPRYSLNLVCTCYRLSFKFNNYNELGNQMEELSRVRGAMLRGLKDYKVFQNIRIRNSKSSNCSYSLKCLIVTPRIGCLSELEAQSKGSYIVGDVVRQTYFEAVLQGLKYSPDLIMAPIRKVLPIRNIRIKAIITPRIDIRE